MIDFNRHIEIDNFLKGKLSPEATTAFEAKLKSDDALQKEVDLQRSADLLVSSAAQFSLKDKLKNIHKEQQKKQIKKKRIINISIGIIVTATLVVLALLINKTDTDDSKVDYNPKIGNEEKIKTKENTSYKTLKQTITEIEVDENGSSNNSLEVSDTSLTNREPSSNHSKSSVPDDNTSNTATVSNKTESGEVDPAPDNEDPVKTKNGNRDPEPDEILTTDVCDGINTIEPVIDVVKPCFGNENGLLKFQPSNNAQFIEYSIDNGEQYVSTSDELEVKPSSYNVIARDGEGCLSAVSPVEVLYDDCNYVIQPNSNRYMNLDLPQSNPVFVFEVRNARSGKTVYTESLEGVNSLEYKGIDQSSKTLPLGNYVYAFKALNNVLIAKGQVTVIK